MIARLLAWARARRCARYVHSWAEWWLYVRTNEEARAFETGWRRACCHCGELQYRRVFFDAIEIPHPNPWELCPP